MLTPRVQDKAKPRRTEWQLNHNHGNLTLNNFVRTTIFVDMIVHIGILDCINSHASKNPF